VQGIYKNVSKNCLELSKALKISAYHRSGFQIRPIPKNLAGLSDLLYLKSYCPHRFPARDRKPVEQGKMTGDMNPFSFIIFTMIFYILIFYFYFQ